MAIKKRVVKKAAPQAAINKPAVPAPAPAPTTPKPEKFVKLLKGTQVCDPITKQIYLVGQLTPVAEISHWARRQAEVYNLLEIIE